MLPIQCVGCGATFDLWKELLLREKNGSSGLKSGDVGFAEYFCPGCRSRIGSQRGNSFLTDAEEAESMDGVQDKFALTWE